MPVGTSRTRTPYKKPYKRSQQQQKDLQKKLVLNLLGMIALAIVVIISLGLFAPKIGYLFGLISRNRNSEEDRISVKPNPPILSDIPNATKEREITINGFAQPGMTVKLFVNGPEKGETTVGADGLFTYTDISLNSGRNTVFVKAIDKFSVESDKSKIYIVNVDSDKPEIDVEEPDNGETVKNLDKRILVQGKVNEKATVTVNDRIAVVRPDLSFEFLLGVDEGSVEIKVKAMDEAGNESEEKIYVTYKKESN